MKQTNQDTNGTSFHSTIINATVNQLSEICGEPETGQFEDKVTHEWVLETDEGEVFTIYDWKEYRQIEDDENIEWHIGGKSAAITERAKQELLNVLHPLPF